MAALGSSPALALAAAPLEIFEELDSTKEEARRRVEAGHGAPVWIMALRQFDGKGRRGRVWESPPGNLALTGLFTFDGPAADIAQLSFVAALAAADMAIATLPADARRDLVSLKWPNDLLLDGRKAAGLLIEAGRAPGGPHWATISIGANLAAAPPPELVDRPAASLAEFGGRAPPGQAAEHFIAAFARYADVLAREGFPAIRSAWLQRASGLGEAVEARLPAETVRGIFRDLAPDGALVLETPDGELRRIAAGDIYFQDRDRFWRRQPKT
jgi:BirA family biotin operon repressor/biotin-[acetyl-CoA-carboxylase] ligase